MNKNKKWAKHIIKKFGTIQAYDYAIHAFGCPCLANFMICSLCEYNQGLSSTGYRTLGCKDAHKFRDYIHKSSFIIEKKIDEIKQIIIKRCVKKYGGREECIRRLEKRL